MRFTLTVPILLLAACAAPPRGPIHPAVFADAEISDELKQSFFESFDEDSFRALAERAFRDGNADADKLLNDIVWNWHPGIPGEKGCRLRARLLLPPLAGHPDPLVRAGIWRVGRLLYDEPATSAAWSSVLRSALRDPDPDVRLAALNTSTHLHEGWPGGCVVEAKKTSFSLRPHAAQLMERLFEEPDARVRLALLRALALIGRRQVLPAFTRYFSEADRREEMGTLRWAVHALFGYPEAGVDAAQSQLPGDQDAHWARMRGFSDSLQATATARRNGIVLLLSLCEDRTHSLDEDRPFLTRVVQWLEREPEIVREEDLLLIVGQWRVMDPEKVVHDLGGFLRRSTLPELLKGLQEHLAALP